MFLDSYNDFHLNIVVGAVSGLASASGIAESWTSPVLPRLSEDPAENDIFQYRRPISISEESNIVSLLQLGSAFGCIVSIYTSSRIGKKKTLILFGTLIVASYLLTCFGRDISYLYPARFLVGFGSSICFTIVPQYLNELLYGKKKESLYNSLGIFLALGILFSYIVGPYADIRKFSFLCFMITGFTLIVFNALVPETPLYLISIGETKQAETWIRKFRRGVDEEDIQKELAAISNAAEEDETDNSQSGGFCSLKLKLRPFLICVGLLCFQELSGISIILSYMETIFLETRHAISPLLSSKIIGCSKLVAALMMTYFMKKINKRNLLLFSSAGSCLSLASLGAYFYMKHNNYAFIESIHWLPMVSLVAYMFSFNTGFEYVAWTISTKVFQPHADLFASSVAHSTSKFIAFSLTYVYPHLAENFGAEYCFWVLSSFCLLAMIFVMIFIPKDDDFNVGQSKAERDLHNPS